MDKCNRKCYWNMDGICVSERANMVYEHETFQTDKCIGFLREDMEEHMNQMKYYILKHIRDLSYLETAKIYKMIEKGEM